MHVSIHIQVFLAHRIQHAQGLLCGSRIIQIDQRFLIYLPLKNGEVFSNFLNVVHIISEIECKDKK